MNLEVQGFMLNPQYCSIGICCLTFGTLRLSPSGVQCLLITTDSHELVSPGSRIHLEGTQKYSPNMFSLLPLFHYFRSGRSHVL